jgi:hypothetical protein
MTEPEIRALFATEASGDPPPSQVHQVARRRGRSRLRWRRAGLTGTSALAAAAVAAIVVAAVPARPGSQPAGAGQAAPRQFNPQFTSVSFGLLPPGQSVQDGGVQAQSAFMGLGTPGSLDGWQASAYARGMCHLTGHASGLNCPGKIPLPMSVKFSKPAPAVHGHRAFWTDQGLVWEYAHGGWALLGIPVPDAASTLQQHPELLRLGLKVAQHVRIGAGTLPIAFPAQFTSLNSQWRVGQVTYSAGAGVLEATHYVLLSGSSRFLPRVGDLGVWTNAPYIDAAPDPGHRACLKEPGDTRKTINGHLVTVGHGATGGEPDQLLCAHFDGLAFHLEEFGSHPPISVTGLFGHHVQLLGPNPAKWTSNPIS